MAIVRDADLRSDLEAIRRLWLAYLTWGNDELEARHGVRFPIQEMVENDLAHIEKFAPPSGRLLLAIVDDEAVGTASLQRIADGIAEIKRMYVDPRHRRHGLARAMLDRLVAAARAARYISIRLDSPDFMTGAHSLYQSTGFVRRGPYPESEIPDQFKSHWRFMEMALR